MAEKKQEQVPLTSVASIKDSTDRSSLRSVKSMKEGENRSPTAPRLHWADGELRPNTAKSHIGDTLYFRDGKRRIDYVLVYTVDPSEKGPEADKRATKRKGFEHKLKEAGIDLEHELPNASSDGKTAFVKLHGTWGYLMTQAEALKIRMPLRISDVKMRSKLRGTFDRFLKYSPFKLTDKNIPQETDHFTAVFDHRYVDQFVNSENPDIFFSSAQRARMVWDTLLRTSYDTNRFGIKRLLRKCAYEAAFPLHEDFDMDKKASTSKRKEAPSERQILYDTWASPSQFYKYQPFSLIRKYFGEKITIYFAWLGFYTKALIPAAIAGLVCILYGWSTLAEDIPSTDICDTKKDAMGLKPMCPSTKVTKREIWYLSDSCLFSKVTYVFDNTATVIFAVFMSIWATMFLEGWKRRQAELAWDWDMHDADLEEEALRPEYQSGVKTLKVNPITNELEPHMPYSKRVLRLLGSVAAVASFLCLVLAFVFGIVVYRMTMVPFFEGWSVLGPAKIVATSVTAASLNLVVIMILDYVYQYLAWILTNWEFPRTEQQFEDSYTFKVFFFQFINYYSSLFYIAFIKGRFSAVPGKHDTAALGSPEPCDPAGCMVELLIQLSIIMVGKQFFNNFLEIIWPVASNRWRKCRRKSIRAKAGESRWEKDYHLSEVAPLNLFSEYLEMVLQYGFITLFVAAFPLAPFFALINNVMEIRLDAYKFLVPYRRPMPARARDLGAWFKILDTISHIAVLTNACVIAFTSDFVPRLFYKYQDTNTFRNLDNYVKHSLSEYSTVKECMGVNVTGEKMACNYPTCYYRDHRDAPCINGTTDSFGNTVVCKEENLYGYTREWWELMVARLAFILIFEHVVFLIKFLVAYFIPDMPRYIVIQMQREHYLAKQALYKRAYGQAHQGQSDTEPSDGGETKAAIMTQDANVAGVDSPMIDKKTNGKGLGAGKLSGSRASVKSDFRYSPAASPNSSDDEKGRKKKVKIVKPPIGRMRL